MWHIFSRNRQKNNLTWMGVDMHSHILPGLDDGCKDVEQSTTLLERLAAMGLAKFHFTPHVFQDMYPNTRERIAAAFSRLQLTGAKDLLAGYAAEYMVDLHFDQLLHSEGQSFACLPDKHILIEMSYIQESKNIEKSIFDLQVKGYKPILAHPERYVFYHQEPQRIQRFKDLGCLLQVNLLSVLGYYGPRERQVALQLLQRGAIDFVGSDVHHERHVKTLERGLQKEDISKYFKKCNIRNAALFSCKT
ncbi:histidinol phosphatase [Sphingobacterium oryzagri]|uniref:protein-tyrosine-phosphatase n=1 Tax=Sphingobacterium oryzagri TaxID=3025669 RepID=A0ABY7WNR2_9SPHI|nr:CpsB/CapC family capsule biosynthesis tyrosine phosphatase [Sphingobacterium sp. KACC 22765]WDF68984.1 histidinol phosphatase [Sphingobacterium sp. KACC 22765]